jgi:hypothetical protein
VRAGESAAARAAIFFVLSAAGHRSRLGPPPYRRVDGKEIRPSGVPEASIVGRGAGGPKYGAMRYAYCALRGAHRYALNTEH